MADEAQPRLALSDVFSNSSPEPEGSRPSPEPKAEEAKTEDKPVEVKPEEAAPAKVEAAQEKPPEATPEAEVKAKAEEKPPEEKAKEEPPKVNWDSDDNPHFAKEKELDARLKATRDWDTRLNQQNAELARKLEILSKKLDGTYDPAVDDQPKTTLDEAAVKGRIEASENAAYSIYGNGDLEKGKQVVEETLTKFNEQFGKHQLVQMRCLNSPTPIIEAMKVMEEAEVLKELGPDPRQWKANLRKAILAEEEPKITERVSKELMARLSKQDKVAPTLTNVRGAGKEMGEKPAFTPASLDSVFSH